MTEATLHSSSHPAAPAIKTAVVGYGFSAQTFHLPFIRILPEYQLVAISSSQIEAVNRD